VAVGAYHIQSRWQLAVCSHTTGPLREKNTISEAMGNWPLGGRFDILLWARSSRCLCADLR
jgi:hypothetical protein